MASLFGRRRPAVSLTSPIGFSETKGGRALAVSTKPLNRAALTASAERVNRKNADNLRRLVQPWQIRALNYYDILGEIKNATTFFANGLSNLELFAAEKRMGQDGKIEIVPTENPEAIAQLERVQDPGGGRSVLLANYGRLMFLTGEAYLFVSEDDGEEQWEMLSSDELRIQGNQYLRYKAPSLGAEEYRETNDDDWEPVGRDALAYRLWRRHPRYSAYADASMQGVLDLCEELILLTQAVRARARSRLAGNGILAIPEELSPAPLEATPDEDPVEDPFMRDLIEVLTTPITDEGSAAAVVPLLLRGAAEHLEKIRHIQIVDPTQLYPETGLRRECIDRIAVGLDMPPERLTGIGGLNHWSGWLVTEEGWRSYLQPLAQQLVDDLSASFFRPTLHQAGVANWQTFVVAYDAAGVINHPNRGKDAKDLHALGVLGDDALREANGFDPSDAPTESERLVFLSIKSRDPGFALTGVPSRPTIAGAETQEEERKADPDAAEAVEKDAPDTKPGEGEATDPEAGLVGAAVAANGNGDQYAVLAARIVGAADLAVARCRELAGNRARNAIKRDPELLKLVDGVPAREVCAVLGKANVPKALGDARALVAGVEALVADAFRVAGLPDVLIERVVGFVEAHAARTLYEKNHTPLPTTFQGFVTGHLSAATPKIKA